MYRIILKAIGLMSSGLIAGSLFYAYYNMLPAFKEVPAAVHLTFRTTLMKHNGISMPVLMAIAIVSCVLLYFSYPKEDSFSKKLIVAAALLLIATLLVTFFGNVPINRIIKTWDPLSPPLNWTKLLSTWEFFHIIRTCTALLGFIGMITVVLLPGHFKK